MVTVLLSAGDPERLAEATEAAVVPPELINECIGRLRGAVIARKAEDDLAQGSLMRVQPMVMWLAKAQTLGLIARTIKAWSIHVDHISKPIGRLHRGAAAVVSYHKSLGVGL
ncbi:MULTISPECIES: hydrogenase accessory protein [unclassified Bradyrhizobium]|uniref:hydrogenase accessory protein n=1 Tax=unclassified Bradyrhizobium TaxID=2631580 RepID=UPI0020B3EE78|nr:MULTISPECIES: hydrogenase accessory protein [unclassified Bradyrhizobium]MCP3380554.1 hydrogenase accessory protein [Bradyrhizobium sp. CCGUVB4N]MCP3441424.1 hydrogenase accessory protein [Bradyrhizobium sp. CCGUVB14]